MSQKVLDYQTLNDRLDAILAMLQQPDIQVNKAVELYEEGLNLIVQLEDHVSQAENKLESLNLQATEAED